MGHRRTEEQNDVAGVQRNVAQAPIIHEWFRLDRQPDWIDAALSIEPALATRIDTRERH